MPRGGKTFVTFQCESCETAYGNDTIVGAVVVDVPAAAAVVPAATADVFAAAVAVDVPAATAVGDSAVAVVVPGETNMPFPVDTSVRGQPIRAELLISCTENQFKRYLKSSRKLIISLILYFHSKIGNSAVSCFSYMQKVEYDRGNPHWTINRYAT